MDRFKVLFSALLLVSSVLVACDDDEVDTNVPGPSPTGNVYEVVGGVDKIKAGVESFLGKVLADDRLNGYFLNQGGPDGTVITDCFVKEIALNVGGSANDLMTAGITNCPDDFDLEAVHRGLGISQNEFGALLDDLTLAFRETLTLGVKEEPPYVNALVNVIKASGPDIVEDPDNNLTIYQRLGQLGTIKSGKTAIIQVVDDATGKILADASINGFFGSPPTASPRFKTCLVRQLCEVTGGPCRYGLEVMNAAEPGVPPVCRNMVQAHTGLPGGPVTAANFITLAGHVATALDTLAGAMPPSSYARDKCLISNALISLCADIVSDDANCPAPATCP